MGVHESTLLAVVDFDGGLMDGDEKEYLGCDREGGIFSIDDIDGRKGTETTERKRVTIRLFPFSINRPQPVDAPDEHMQLQQLLTITPLVAASSSGGHQSPPQQLEKQYEHRSERAAKLE
jgi:hypothetical protein